MAHYPRYSFEDEQLTLGEILGRVPCLSRTAILTHLRAGRDTRTAMLSYSRPGALRAAGRKGRAAGPFAGFLGAAPGGRDA